MVLSLDFELHWGMRDHVAPGDPAYRRLRPSRDAVRHQAALFAERGIRATWATVGFLFARDRAELAASFPEARPTYADAGLDPYRQPVGADEEEDPEHLAGSLVDLLAATPGQEVASHTHSHFYCLEDGQDETQFRADLSAAQALAARRGLRLTSLVMPRNQWNPSYAGAVLDAGFTCVRGPQPSRGHAARPHDRQSLVTRCTRLVDTYAGAGPPPTTAWADVRRPDGLCDVPASAFLRPFSSRRRALEPLRRARLRAGLQDAARRQRIFHLWWHPHNVVGHEQESYDLLRWLFDEYARLADAEGLRSLTMGDAAAAVSGVGAA